MISFVWSSKVPFSAGKGGSENYTAGHIRELMRRGIPTRLMTVGIGEDDGHEDFPDITFTSVASHEQLSELDDTLVGITFPIAVPTRRPSYTILHCPPTSSKGPLGQLENLDATEIGTTNLMAPSKFAARLWANKLQLRPNKIKAVYPFADRHFATAKRPEREGAATRILFAGRLMPDKGIFTLLAALHLDEMHDLDYELTVTAAGGHTESGPIIRTILEAHPWVHVVEARRTPKEMAALMAEHDVVVMPSSDIFWKETFGMVSVEAQHAGCRVVASNSGGIPETDCGGLLLIRPDDPQALARGIIKASMLGPLTVAERMYASSKFTVASSVDRLLSVMQEVEHKRPLLLQKQSALVREQLDMAFGTIQEFGLRLARENKLR